jgi:hypothetical protein
MRACWREGIVPLLQMHDSLDCSVTSPEQAERVAQLAREVVSLAVPIRVDLGFGRNWGDAKHTWAELHASEEASAPSVVPAEEPSFAPADDDTGEMSDGDDAVTDEAPPWDGAAAFDNVAAETASPEPSQSNRRTGGNGHAVDDFPAAGGKVLCPFHDDHSPSLHIYPAVDDPRRGAAMIENLSISLLGGIQPEPMRKIAADTIDDGLLQRLIPIVLRRASAGKDSPTGQAAQRYDHLVERLHRRERPLAPLRFDDAALAIREGLERRHLDLMACEIVNRKLAAHIGKYDG